MIYDQDGISYGVWKNVPKKDISCYEWAKNEEPDFPLPPEAILSHKVPKGTLTEHMWKSRVVYPGVSGKYDIYIPSNYNGQETALMVFLDGVSQYINIANVPTILDNMIHCGKLPATIALFVEWGNPGPGLPRYAGKDHRSIEYDSVDDRYVIFLEDEILAPLYKDYNITKDPKKRIICGISSGGIAAFAAAWHRPDLFGKVISHCGSFTAIRGGDVFPSMIRQSTKKPLKIFLQTGEHDLNTCFGDLKLANLTMASALEYKDYEYKLIVGPGGHSLHYGASILPETLRWILE